MFHPHSEGPRSVHRIFQNSLGENKTCAEPTSGKASFDGLKTARRVMSLPETLCGLLLMPGTLCSVFGPQGIQLRRIHLPQETTCFRSHPKNQTQIFELNVFCHRLYVLGSDEVNLE